MLQEFTSYFQDNNYSKPIIYSITPQVKLFGTETENLFHSHERKPRLDLRDIRYGTTEVFQLKLLHLLVQVINS